VPWVIALVIVLIATGVAAALTKPFSSGGAGTPGVAESADPTGIYTVTRQDLSSQTQLSATLGYDGSYSVAVASGMSVEDVTLAQETMTEDQQTLSADEQTESDASSADDQVISADQTDVTTDQTTLSADQASEYQDCAGSGASSAACTQVAQKVSSDQTALTQADQQLATAQSTATLDHDPEDASPLLATTPTSLLPTSPGSFQRLRHRSARTTDSPSSMRRPSRSPRKTRPARLPSWRASAA
jgi:hypothetical protein